MSDHVISYSYDDFMEAGIKAFVPEPILEQQKQIDNILNLNNNNGDNT